MKKRAVLWMLAALLMLLPACSGSSGNGGNSSANGGNAVNSGGNAAETEAGDKPQTNLRIAWWGGDKRHEYTQQVIEMYQQQNPHVKIDVEYAAFDDYWKKLAPQAAAKQLPDIVQMDISYIVQYAKNGQLEDLSSLIGNPIKLDDVNENVISTGQVDGVQYGIPTGVNVLGFHYDPALLAKAGVDAIPEDWTWDQYVDIALKARDTGLVFDSSMQPDVFFHYFLRTKGLSLYNKEGTALGYEDDALFSEFFGRLANLIKEGAVPSQEKLTQTKGILEEADVVKGTGIGVWQWSNQYVALQAAVNRPMQLAPMAGPDMQKGLYMQPSMFWSVTSTSKNKEEAARFIDFWINNLDANKRIKGERGVPISAAIKEAIMPELTEPEQQVFDFVAAMEANSSPMSPAPPVGSPEVIASLSDLVEQINFGQITAEDAAKKFREEANAILANNK
ncbi:extracellular solute-binding protein [Paenibacillus macerans]|uniref:extracellular solute-binding protein n=1 Tax=Paenibacillus macerans TaxID=44252 RepID=UPI003D3181AF